jgi:hypothetical protein
MDIRQAKIRCRNCKCVQMREVSESEVQTWLLEGEEVPEAMIRGGKFHECSDGQIGWNELMGFTRNESIP